MPPFDQAGIGQEILHPLKALEVVDLVEQGEGEDFADAGNRAQQREFVPRGPAGPRGGLSLASQAASQIP